MYLFIEYLIKSLNWLFVFAEPGRKERFLYLMIPSNTRSGKRQRASVWSSSLIFGILNWQSRRKRRWPRYEGRQQYFIMKRVKCHWIYLLASTLYPSIILPITAPILAQSPPMFLLNDTSWHLALTCNELSFIKKFAPTYLFQIGFLQILNNNSGDIHLLKLAIRVQGS